ncbi:MAG: S-adenosylmethionine-dependent methyltransferase [Alyxoria varia]|nr:MAG: S-adenosylmethionine-dependent methyltransferase [Alyxoria varia]
MLPTPNTSHVDIDKVYDPSEDSYLLLDALGAEEETAFLKKRFQVGHAPLVVEVGTGSGVALAFVHANARAILGRNDGLCLGTDINAYACRAACQTIKANEPAPFSSSSRDGDATESLARAEAGLFLGCVNADLASPLPKKIVDVLIFNPPYVPSESVPLLFESKTNDSACEVGEESLSNSYIRNMHLQALATDGGEHGMEVTDRLLKQIPEVLSKRGVAYVLLCARNRPVEVKERIWRKLGVAWDVETVRTSGKWGGWEKLQIMRISRVAL